MSLNTPASASTLARRSVPVALVAVLVLVVAGVGIAVTAAYFELRPAPPPRVAQPGSPPPPSSPTSVTVTDDEGRSVTAPYNASRVVVLAPSILDSMFRLGLRDRVVGVDCGTTGLSTDYNSSQDALWSLTDAMCVGTYPSLDVPQLLLKSPELVLVATTVSLSDVEELTTTYDLPVLVLQPATLGGISVDVELLAQLFPVAAAASALVGELQQVLGNASLVQTNLTDSGAPLPTVLLTYYADSAGSPEPGYYSYGPGTFGESLIEFVGAVSVGANASLPYPILSGSQVLLADPAVIIYGTGFGVDLSVYSAGPDWTSFEAVSSGHDFGIDSNLLTEPDPTMILDGMPILFDLVHPGLYPPSP